MSKDPTNSGVRIIGKSASGCRYVRNYYARGEKLTQLRADLSRSYSVEDTGLPVTVVEPEQAAHGEHAGREQQQAQYDARHPVERKPGGSSKLGGGYGDHHGCVAGKAAAADWAMVHIGEMDVAHRVSARPERSTAAVEDPVADVDEEQARGDERNAERQDPVSHSAIIEAA